ncbi:hypothetical protein TYRP_017917 [Tyrophagus putrescentiae]|nr:hypothetical protein TYRP_017917 [Tyrophagus putrescentiae]
MHYQEAYSASIVACSSQSTAPMHACRFCMLLSASIIIGSLELIAQSTLHYLHRLLSLINCSIFIFTFT